MTKRGTVARVLKKVNVNEKAFFYAFVLSVPALYCALFILGQQKKHFEVFRDKTTKMLVRGGAAVLFLSMMIDIWMAFHRMFDTSFYKIILLIHASATGAAVMWMIRSTDPDYEVWCRNTGKIISVVLLVSVSCFFVCFVSYNFISKKKK